MNPCTLCLALEILGTKNEGQGHDAMVDLPGRESSSGMEELCTLSSSTDDLLPPTTPRCRTSSISWPWPRVSENNSTPLRNSQLRTTASPAPRPPPTGQEPALSGQGYRSHFPPPKGRILDLQPIGHMPALKVTQLIRDRPYQKIICSKEVTWHSLDIILVIRSSIPVIVVLGISEYIPGITVQQTGMWFPQ